MPAPGIAGVLETCLYVDDVEAAADFYRSVLGLAPIFAEERLVSFAVASASVLLLFQRGGTPDPVETPGGTIPPHDGSGPMHMAFAIAEADLAAWRERFAEFGVEIVSEVGWPQGGTSLYVHDPAGNVVELATPGLWPNYSRGSPAQLAS